MQQAPKLKLPDFAKLTTFNKLDREFDAANQRIEVHQDGNVTIVYHSKV
jgi:hypothetical protein